MFCEFKCGQNKCHLWRTNFTVLCQVFLLRGYVTFVSGKINDIVQVLTLSSSQIIKPNMQGNNNCVIVQPDDKTKFEDNPTVLYSNIASMSTNCLKVTSSGQNRSTKAMLHFWRGFRSTNGSSHKSASKSHPVDHVRGRHASTPVAYTYTRGRGQRGFHLYRRNW